MLKKLLFILLTIFIIPVQAESFHEAYNNGDNVFLYIYTPECKYCNIFYPIYKKITKVYDNHYTFIKINANTYEGSIIMREFGARFVPFVVLLNKNKNEILNIPPYCLIDRECVDHQVNRFKSL